MIGSQVHFYNAKFDTDVLISNIANLGEEFCKEPIVSELILTLYKSNCLCKEAILNTKQALIYVKDYHTDMLNIPEIPKVI